jgi:hypothetical protein
MSQVAGWFYPVDEPHYTVVECPRRDCRILAKQSVNGGPCELLPAHSSHVIALEATRRSFEAARRYTVIQRAILTILLRYERDDTDTLDRDIPCLETIAWGCSCSERTVRVHLKLLVEEGLVRILPTAVGSGRQPTMYQVMRMRVEELGLMEALWQTNAPPDGTEAPPNEDPGADGSVELKEAKRPH